MLATRKSMGYEVYITRKDWQSEEDGPEISLEEWVDFVAKDPEFKLDSFAEAELPDGKYLCMESEGLSVWEGYSKNESKRGGNKAWFLYSHGEISVKKPDQELLCKMHEVAQSLSAKVQGDGGELYNENGVTVIANEKKPWWKFW